jgi:hypothetical protein
MHSLLGPAGFLEPVPSRSPCEPARQDTAERPGGLPVLSCHFLDGRDDGIEHPRVAERAGVVEQAVVIDDVVEDRVAGLGTRRTRARRSSSNVKALVISASEPSVGR